MKYAKHFEKSNEVSDFGKNNYQLKGSFKYQLMPSRGGQTKVSYDNFVKGFRKIRKLIFSLNMMA